MKFANATNFNRKSGEAEGSAVPRTSPGNAFSTLDERPSVWRTLLAGRYTGAPWPPGSVVDPFLKWDVYPAYQFAQTLYTSDDTSPQCLARKWLIS
jgi:hypothetical protein